MNKLFLMCGVAAACGMPMAAQEADPAIGTVTTYKDIQLTQISDNGRYIGSSFYGVMVLINLETGEQTVFGSSEEGGGGVSPFMPKKVQSRDEAFFYGFGHGRSISDNGVVVGSTTEASGAEYMEGGEWKTLPVKKTDVYSNFAWSITPDARRITGAMGRSGDMTQDGAIPNDIPVLWNLGSNGTYDMYVELPYPALDFSGRVPQYVMPTQISADGKTLVGQVQDYLGMVPEPIVWKEDADGKWSYILPMESVFRPEGITWPEFPGSFDKARPSYESYMTQAERDAYTEAYDAWVAGGYQGDAPDYKNYMTEDELALYNKDLAEYQEEYDAWDVKYSAFVDFFWTFIDEHHVPMFTFNTNILSSNGRYFVQCAEVEDDSDPMAWMPETIYMPYLMDLEAGTFGAMKVGDKSMSPTFVSNEGVTMAAYPADSYAPMGYVAEGPDKEFGTLAEWLLGEGQDDMYNWVLDNMEHDVAVDYDYETGEMIYEKQIITGAPFATPGLKEIVSYAMNMWNENDPTLMYSYLFTLGREPGFVGIQNVDNNVAKQVMGRDYYDLQGRRIANPATGTLVIEKVTYTDGTTTANKIVR